MSKQYMVVALCKDGRVEPVRDHDNGIMVFMHGQDATNYARALTEAGYQINGIKYQARPILDENADKWPEREAQRLESGEYQKVPWHDEPWAKKFADKHFVHVSKDDVTRIAYTQDEEKGRRDVQTRVNVGKYLKQYYSDTLSEEAIRLLCATYRKLYGSDYELKFAKSAEEIVSVYANGPGSCMAGAKSVRAYAGPDLEVAYIQRKENITARTVVWPEKKLYCEMVYGDSDLLTQVLEDEGYEASYRFQGARLTAIRKPRRAVDVDYYKRCGYKGDEYYYEYEIPSIEFANCGLLYGEDYVTVK